MTRCPFKVGDDVVYRPSAIGRDKSLMTDIRGLVPGGTYRIAAIIKEVYLVLDGLEASPTGGLHWTEFQPRASKP